MEFWLFTVDPVPCWCSWESIWRWAKLWTPCSCGRPQRSCCFRMCPKPRSGRSGHFGSGPLNERFLFVILPVKKKFKKMKSTLLMGEVPGCSEKCGVAWAVKRCGRVSSYQAGGGDGELASGFMFLLCDLKWSCWSVFLRFQCANQSCDLIVM